VQLGVQGTDPLDSGSLRGLQTLALRRIRSLGRDGSFVGLQLHGFLGPTVAKIFQRDPGRNARLNERSS
jgi:hypothetical protein